jgi:phosphatidylserine decarboxylase
MKPLFILFQYLIPQHLLSRLVGRLADCRWNWLKNLLIKAFIRAYKVNMSEAVFSEAADFSCFNDFFTRQLQPDARLACAEANVLISPADGAISEFGSIDNDKLLQAKGRHYTLGELLGDANGTAKQFLNGDFITIYLSPKDYHRVHAPTSGKLIESHYIPGKLFSVNESSVSSIPNIFARNERLVTTFETDHGKVALIMVGAMIVAGIKSSWNEEIYW